MQEDARSTRLTPFAHEALARFSLVKRTVSRPTEASAHPHAKAVPKKSNEHIGLQQYISCYDSKERKRSEEKANESKVRECIDDSKEQEEESAPMHQGITTKRDV